MLNIYLDFDGTMVEHAYPQVGRFNPGAVQVVKQLQEKGYDLFLNTYRADIGPTALLEALKYMVEAPHMHLADWETFAFKFKTLEAKSDPRPYMLSDTLCYHETAHGKTLFLDDHSAGIPLRPALSVRGMMVDWNKVERHLKTFGVL